MKLELFSFLVFYYFGVGVGRNKFSPVFYGVSRVSGAGDS